MAIQVQLRRGTTAQNDSFIGAVGEVTVDTSKYELRVHDGETEGGHKVGSGYHPDLFDWKWADHEINDMQWVRSDTFSWQDGTIYSSAYQHLLDDITPVIDPSNVQSETISGITIYFRVAPDGHKICTSDQESYVAALYEATGVAWYYIIDRTNQRFKLPRTAFGVTGFRDTVGKYIVPALPNFTANINGIAGHDGNVSATGGASVSRTSGMSYTGGGDASYWLARYNIGINASDSSSVYQNNATVQPPATQMYLYFYVGEFTQTALENTAGLNAEMFNDLNSHKVIAFQAPTAENNYTWYRKYADGWVEQGGSFTGVSGTITLPVVMTDTNYTLLMLPHLYDNNAIQYYQAGHTKTTIGFSYDSLGSRPFDWLVSGMAA